jgi:hypothetical protein
MQVLQPLHGLMIDIKVKKMLLYGYIKLWFALAGGETYPPEKHGKLIA